MKRPARIGSAFLLGVFIVIVTAGVSGAPGCNTQECDTDPMAHVRDPTNGACVTVTNEDACKYCVSRSETCIVGDPGPLDFADCAPCPAADEATCLASDGCRAIYHDGGYTACWPTAPSGPVHTGACVGLDAHACSRHDNCTAWYAGAGGAMAFDHCEEEIRAIWRSGRPR
ncbi:MAG TPA: hypothetical protein VFK02_02920 [Kofleriaceae bacterium]|nr:hypothetical protein [Kofleriaceae bacterium]